MVRFTSGGLGRVCAQQSEGAHRVGIIRGSYLRTVKFHVLDLAGLNAGRAALVEFQLIILGRYPRSRF